MVEDEQRKWSAAGWLFDHDFKTDWLASFLKPCVEELTRCGPGDVGSWKHQFGKCDPGQGCLTNGVAAAICGAKTIRRCQHVGRVEGIVDRKRVAGNRGLEPPPHAFHAIVADRINNVRLAARRNIFNNKDVMQPVSP